MEMVGKKKIALKLVSKRYYVIDWAVFAVLLIIVSAVTLTLFYRQAVYPDIYLADVYWYMLEVEGVETGLTFPYPIYFKLSKLIALAVGTELAVAICTMLFNGMALVAIKSAMNKLVLPILEISLESRWGKNGAWVGGIVVSFLSVSLFFVSMLYPLSGTELSGISSRYLGVFSPNPFHNATYLAARPFAVLAFLWYGRLLPVYEKGIAWRGRRGGASMADYVLFSLFLLLTTMTKPSFTLLLVSTAGMLMLYRLIRERFQNFLSTIQLGLCFIPTFIELLYQYQRVYMAGSSQIRFGFGEVWLCYTENLPLAVCLGMGFPLIVLAVNWRACKKSTLFCFSWQLYLTGFAEAFLLYEDGKGKQDFNFAWGYMYGMFFCYLTALLTLIQMTARHMDREAGEKAGAIELGLLIVQWMLYFCHLICGIFYFKELLEGKRYF